MRVAIVTYMTRLSNEILTYFANDILLLPSLLGTLVFMTASADHCQTREIGFHNQPKPELEPLACSSVTNFHYVRLKLRSLSSNEPMLVLSHEQPREY